MGVIVAAQKRPLSTIAEEIFDSWGDKISEHALPYLNPMLRLTHITDTIGHDDAEMCVRYFLNNAQGWRGEDAKRIKAELRAMLTKPN